MICLKGPWAEEQAQAQAELVLLINKFSEWGFLSVLFGCGSCAFKGMYVLTYLWCGRWYCIEFWIRWRVWRSLRLCERWSVISPAFDLYIFQGYAPAWWNQILWFRYILGLGEPLVERLNVALSRVFSLLIQVNNSLTTWGLVDFKCTAYVCLGGLRSVSAMRIHLLFCTEVESWNSKCWTSTRERQIAELITCM